MIALILAGVVVLCVAYVAGSVWLASQSHGPVYQSDERKRHQQEIRLMEHALTLIANKHSQRPELTAKLTLDSLEQIRWKQ